MRHVFRAFRKLLAAGVCVSALAAAAPGMTPARQKFIGTVHIYGSEPRTYVGLKDESDGKVYTIDSREKESELRGLQGKRIEFIVRLSDRQAFPPSDGMVTVISYTILN